MKQLKKKYAFSLIPGIAFALLVLIFLAIGMIGGENALLIPWTVSVQGASADFGFLNISYRFLLNLFLCFGNGGWAWDFVRILIPAGFWAAIIFLVLGIIMAIRNDARRNLLPLVFLVLDVIGGLWVLEGINFAQSVGAMRLRYAFAFGVAIGGGIVSIIFLLIAMFRARQIKMTEVVINGDKENEKKIAELEARVAVLETKAVVVAPAAAVEEPAVVDEAKGGLNIQRIPFEVKLANAEQDIKDKYAELAAYITDNYGIKARQSIAGVSFSAHREKLVFVTIIGKHLRTNYALDAKDYNDSTLPVTMSENKKYQDTPLTLKVKSDLSLRRAKGLVDDVMNAKGIKKIAK